MEKLDTKEEYLTRTDLLEKYKHQRLIIDAPLSVFDLLIVQGTDGQIGLFLHDNFNKEIGNTMIKQLRISGNTLYFYPYKEGDKIREGCKLYTFNNGIFEQVVTFTDIEDEILEPIEDYLEKRALGYTNCKLVIKQDGDSFLEIELLDECGEIPIESYVISKEMLIERNCIATI